ncbi:GNAT family N-acetyltransferase [Deinococcus hohokamensis]|uniref:GNAT family N-acetyltransferase n=1 Tax=Deinococcus hohokamensis TaxID=309883 RepID=A0ABV9IDE7_9DEIO
MNIKGKKVILRAVERGDLELLHRWANDPDIGQMLGGWHFPGSMDYQEQWFTSLKSDQRNQRFAIETPDLGLVGTANLVDIDWKNGHAHHGMLLGDKDLRGKGYGVDVIMAVMRYAFEELRLHRLDGSIIEYNQPSYRVYVEKCGWVVEGRQREWFFRQNRRWDRLIVGVTRDDYARLLEQNRYWDS